MGSISSVPNGIAYLPPFVNSVSGGPSSPTVGKFLQSATPSDAAEMSKSALQLQEAAPEFSGLQTPPAPPCRSGRSHRSALPSGVSASDITNATPDQQAPIAEQAQALQHVERQFYPPLCTNHLNVLA